MRSIVVRKNFLVLWSLASCAGLGCSLNATSDTGGSGGVGGSAGATGQAGAVQASGGVVGNPQAGNSGGGTAGAAGTGGSTVGNGGVTATGGTAIGGAATGGAATGGTSGTGGAAATAGSSGTGGTATVSIFDGATLNGWHSNPPDAFSVNAADGAIASSGNKRGVCYTENKYSFYRLLYTVRQVHPAGDNHSSGVLFFGTDATKDALWGIQFALPQSWGWDYRGGGSKGTGTSVGKVPNLDMKAWARVELLVNSATGTARAAVAQPVGTRATEVLRFQDSNIPNVPSYFAIQCHTGGQLDEYKDIIIEANPTMNDLITTK
jgi:Domain of Unknown Function (DUF1080)